MFIIKKIVVKNLGSIFARERGKSPLSLEGITLNPFSIILLILSFVSLTHTYIHMQLLFNKSYNSALLRVRY